MSASLVRRPAVSPPVQAPAAAPTPALAVPGPQAGADSPAHSDAHSVSDTPLLDGLAAGPALGTEPAQPAAPEGMVLTSTLRKGARGADVERLQQLLGVEVDGRYGPDTEAAVRAWQEANGLGSDGVIGPESRAFLASNAKGVQIGSTLRTGARGKDVEAVQQFLGLPVDGSFGPQTRLAVIQFQMDRGLVPDGIIGRDTRAALSGVDPKQAEQAGEAAQRQPVGAAPEQQPVGATSEQQPVGAAPERQPVGAAPEPQPVGADTPRTPTPRGELKSRWHDDDKFIPKYASTAYSESSIFRGKADPYAVGAVSNPTRKQDLGGKTYGVYQFESSVYRDGSTRGAKAVAGSTAMRFVNWEGNPYGAELKGIIDRHGMSSAEFDAAWKRISTDDNKAFGEIQEQFMELEREDQVNSFFDRIGASDAAREDPRLIDLVMGTHNQYGGLTKGVRQHVAANNKGGKLSADQIGKMMQDYKRGRVKSHFRSSPSAHKGIYNRIAREKAMFD